MKSEQEILQTLYLTQDLHRACGMMEAKIMKYHVRSGYVRKILAEDQDQDELLDGFSLTSASEINSKSWFMVFTNLHLFI